MKLIAKKNCIIITCNFFNKTASLALVADCLAAFKNCFCAE